MPGREAYMEAVQYSSNFGLPLLKRLKLVRDPNTDEALVWPGAFGIVFRMENDRGDARAVKCFTSAYPIRAERYEAVSDYFDTLFARNRPSVQYLAESYYARQGIQVGRRWQPLLIMDWVEGELFSRHVETLCEQPDSGAALSDLAKRWTDVVRALRADRLVHGDLQHGNVLVLPDKSLKLIDYDGMCVPSLIGRFVLEGGHPNYQHPRRTQQYHERLDEFSALVIFAALVILIDHPELWAKYNTRRNMLFQETDFLRPDASELFTELDTFQEASVRIVTEELKKACFASATDGVPAFDQVATSVGF